MREVALEGAAMTDDIPANRSFRAELIPRKGNRPDGASGRDFVESVSIRQDATQSGSDGDILASLVGVRNCSGVYAGTCFHLPQRFAG